MPPKKKRVVELLCEIDDELGYRGKLSVAVHARFEESDRVLACCRSVRLQNMDPHLLFAQVGEQLGLVPESTVSAAFANIWARVHPDQVQSLVQAVRGIIPELSNPPTN